MRRINAMLPEERIKRLDHVWQAEKKSRSMGGCIQWPIATKSTCAGWVARGPRSTQDRSFGKGHTVEAKRMCWPCLWLAVLLFLLSTAPDACGQSQRLPKVFASGAHGLIVLPSGTVKVFGRNEVGQLGLGTSGNPKYTDDLVDLPGVYDAIDGAAEGDSSFVLRADGTVLAWGENHAGQLGLGTPGVLPKSWDVIKPVSTPTPVPGLAGVRQVATSGGYTLALLKDGTVRAWGAVGSWRLDGVHGSGGEETFRVPFPATVSGLSGVKAVSAGSGFALALMNDGTVKAWGVNKFGEVGDEVISRSPTAITIAGIENAVAVSAGIDYALALLRDGTVRVWGNGGDKENLYHFAGTRDPSIHLGAYSWTAKPIAIPRLREVVAISAGASGVALLRDGTVRVWGYNGYCSMGIGRCTEYPHGLQTPRIANVATIATGFNRTYFVQRDGTVLAAGGHRYSPSQNFPVPTVILSKEQAAQPAPPASARVSLPVTRPEANAAPAPAKPDARAQPGPPNAPPAPAQPKDDAAKQLNEGLNKLREVKGLFGR